MIVFYFDVSCRWAISLTGHFQGSFWSREICHELRKHAIFCLSLNNKWPPSDLTVMFCRNDVKFTTFLCVAAINSIFTGVSLVLVLFRNRKPHNKDFWMSPNAISGMRCYFCSHTAMQHLSQAWCDKIASCFETVQCDSALDRKLGISCCSAVPCQILQTAINGSFDTDQWLHK